MPMEQHNWKVFSKNILKAELTRRDIDYEMLALKLKAIGLDENYNSINTKINRGTFSFVFFVQCMTALDVKTIRLSE